MNERILQYRDKLVQYWKNFNRNQKILLFSTLAFIILAIVVLTIQFTKTEYEVAFQNLDATDSAAVMQYLDGQGITYQLSQDGTTISVPTESAAKAKVAVGSQGLIQNGSIGFSEFNTSSSAIGMTDNEFNVKYRNALNGEVSQLLRNMNGVQNAKVLINLPQESLFATDENQDTASASVVIQFKPGFRASQEAIDGYFNLIHTAVPRLPIDNITITDGTDGSELVATVKGGGSGNLIGAVQDNMALQKKYESDVENNVRQFLSRLLGPDKVNVLVTSTLNFDQRTTKEDRVEPVDTENMQGIAISAQKIQESYTGTSSPDSGTAGTGSTDTPTYPGGSSSGNTSSEKSQSTINYEVNRIHNEIAASPYHVQDLSINVLIDPNPALSTAQQTTLNNQIQTMLQNLVRTSLAENGIDYTAANALQNKVSVVSQPFVTDDGSNTGFLASNWQWIAGVAAALVIGIIALVMYRRRKQQAEEMEEDIMLPPVTELPSISLENLTNDSQVRKQLESLAKKKPDEFVNLLRTWLADE
ncbi:flagellar basal-body MS-ring/collar protein FliF [Paenibacillus hunanensis]|uniref:Flagellar M-ring protein n=1 Tax=Paenibacillus hunanensis TaxID=539262 RepID=A0ABU1J172_9BACL|nr:flagellar basal-body MS-ring/collar protein FliF [Paenibacillus hunanensis]MCL9660197.1 flagellar M-ring protein FliF [Paenibacillus hunanensis]MDR6244717.1 flagellar M-ring protein FliF [Paenibacillus hunanensis]